MCEAKRNATWGMNQVEYKQVVRASALKSCKAASADIRLINWTSPSLPGLQVCTMIFREIIQGLIPQNSQQNIIVRNDKDTSMTVFELVSIWTGSGKQTWGARIKLELEPPMVPRTDPPSWNLAILPRYIHHKSTRCICVKPSFVGIYVSFPRRTEE